MSTFSENPAGSGHALPLKDCKLIRQILARVGDKWTVAILAALADRRMRFKDLFRTIGGISQRMLVVRLKDLERDGFVTRVAYPTVPPRVEYALSALGHSLRQILAPVGAWVLDHRKDIEESRRRFDLEAQKTGDATLIKW